MYVYHTRPVPEQVKKLGCQSNLVRLYQAVLIYSQNYQGKEYPAANKWCDLLIKAGVHSDDASIFVCPSAKPSAYIEQCHYAMNPNTKPHSPSDMVLLFETSEGWNASGGPELVTFENHGDKGCHVLFNNGQTKFITADEAEELTWKDNTKR